MRRWRVEVVIGSVFLVLTALTAVVPTWIEAVFGVEPDAGSGALEWGIVAALGLLSVVSFVLARRDYRAAARAG